MTGDAPLTPANEPDPATLTDEELTLIQEHALFGVPEQPQTVYRLIAALRTSRSAAEFNATAAVEQAAEVERLREALDFYANPENWEPTLIHEAPADGPNPGASEWESGAAIDGGERARRALNVPV